EDKKWYPKVVYAVNDQVGYLGNVYVCIRGHFSRPPDESPQFWKLLYPISNHQVPATMTLFFDVVISTKGKMISKELKGLGWLDNNYREFRDTYLTAVKLDDIQKYLASHPEHATSWNLALKILASSNSKYVRMISGRSLKKEK